MNENVEDVFDEPPCEHPLALDWYRGVSPLHSRCRYCGDIYYVGMNPSKEEEGCCYECFLRVKIISPLEKEASSIEKEISQIRNPIKKFFKQLKYKGKLEELWRELERRTKEADEIKKSKEELERQREEREKQRKKSKS